MTRPDLLFCTGLDNSALDKHLTGHLWHWPVCDCHLTLLFLCPECGIRYDEPDQEERFRILARLLADSVPERALQLAAELVISAYAPNAQTLWPASEKTSKASCSGPSTISSQPSIGYDIGNVPPSTGSGAGPATNEIAGQTTCVMPLNLLTIK